MYRTCCHFWCACVRKRVFIEDITDWPMVFRIDGWRFLGQFLANLPRNLDRFRRNYDNTSSVTRQQRPSSKRLVVLSRRQHLISLRSPFVTVKTRIGRTPIYFARFNLWLCALIRSSNNAVASRCGSTASRLRSSESWRFWPQALLRNIRQLRSTSWDRGQTSRRPRSWNAVISKRRIAQTSPRC